MTYTLKCDSCGTSLTVGSVREMHAAAAAHAPGSVCTVTNAEAAVLPVAAIDDDGYRVGPCDLCGIDHDDALTCDESAAEFAAEKRAGVV